MTWRGMVWWVLGCAVALGLLTFTLTISISPLAHWTQEVGSCRNADSVDRDVEASSAISRAPGSANATQEVATTTFTLACHYGDGVRYVENDPAVLRGMAVGFGIGAIPGALIGLAMIVRDRMKRPPPQAPSEFA